MLQMRLLGTLDIRHDDQALPLPPTLKSQSLLAYLVLHRFQPQSRARLAGLFWGDRPEGSPGHATLSPPLYGTSAAASLRGSLA
jgi:DNA-binding SARP family transcriptional activator